MDVSIKSIGENKGTKRIWLQGNALVRSGFEPKTKYAVNKKDGTIVIQKTEAGIKLREVSSRKRADSEIPIIDLNNDTLATMFEGMEKVRVIYKEGEIRILPIASEVRAKERLDDLRNRIKSGTPLQVGSLAHGGGILSHALEAGFAKAGVKTELAFANEYREDLIDHVMANNSAWSDKTIALQGGMQELAFDEWVMRTLGRVNILEAGLPCSGASVAGRAKRALTHAESHPEVGHLVVAFLAIIAVTNPAVIILENVPQYQNTASMEIIRHQLRDLAYDVHETVLDGGDWNAMEHRKRMVMVAVTRGMDFDFSQLQRPAKVERQLQEILEDIPEDDRRWSKMEGLKAKEIRDAAAGKSFAMQLFNGEDTKIGTLTKGIGKNRSTDPKICHPSDPDLLRLPTPKEHAAAKGIPEELIFGLSATISHELLGQSIIYDPFVSVGSLAADSCIGLSKKSQAINLDAAWISEVVIAKAQREAARMSRSAMH